MEWFCGSVRAVRVACRFSGLRFFAVHRAERFLAVRFRFAVRFAAFLEVPLTTKSTGTQHLHAHQKRAQRLDAARRARGVRLGCFLCPRRRTDKAPHGGNKAREASLPAMSKCIAHSRASGSFRSRCRDAEASRTGAPTRPRPVRKVVTLAEGLSLQGWFLRLRPLFELPLEALGLGGLEGRRGGGLKAGSGKRSTPGLVEPSVKPLVVGSQPKRRSNRGADGSNRVCTF